MRRMGIFRVQLIRFSLLHFDFFCNEYIFVLLIFQQFVIEISRNVCRNITYFFFCSVFCYMTSSFPSVSAWTVQVIFRLDRFIYIYTHSPEAFESYLLGWLTVPLRRLVWMTYQIRFHKRYFVSIEIINSEVKWKREKTVAAKEWKIRSEMVSRPINSIEMISFIPSPYPLWYLRYPLAFFDPFSPSASFDQKCASH